MVTHSETRILGNTCEPRVLHLVYKDDVQLNTVSLTSTTDSSCFYLIQLKTLFVCSEIISEAMKTFFETQAINMVNARFKERKLPGAFCIGNLSHCATIWTLVFRFFAAWIVDYYPCSREAQNLKLLVNSSPRSMLLLSSKLLIRKSSGYTQPNSTPLGM